MTVTNCRSRGSQNPPVKPQHFFKLCIILLFLISALSVSAQDFHVSGKVTGEDGTALIGVTVSVKGNKAKAVVTDAAGAFSITLPSGKETLILTYVGFNDQEIAVENRNTINITMAPST